MKRTLFKAALAGGLTLSGTLAAFADDGRRYEITIRNAMLGQPVAPSLFVTHSSAFTLFEIGDAASLGLATMAETGAPFTLFDEVDIADGVSDAVILPFAGMPPIMPPGEHNSTEITALGNAKYFSAIGMLAATNDALYAVRNVALPKTGSITVYADVYDAGSETNSELLADIPAGGNDAFDSPMDAGEGYIHIHAGIHGVPAAGGLDPNTYDWRNPAVEVTITRLNPDD